MEKIIIFGASGHAKVAIDIFERSGKYEILGLLDSNKEKGSLLLGYKVLGGIDEIPSLVDETPNLKFFIAIGDNWKRYGVAKSIGSLGISVKFANAIHPTAIIGKNVAIGKGVMIVAGAIVNADSILEDFTIVNTNSSVGHESVLKEYSSLSSGVTLGGKVEVGEFTAIGIGATVINGIRIGKHTVIGAGSVNVQNADDFGVLYGVPARLVRNRVEGEEYLKP
ncbi:MAG: acetyltransferase [Allomuricauda sp.]